jgi:hypothetical protein
LVRYARIQPQGKLTSLLYPHDFEKPSDCCHIVDLPLPSAHLSDPRTCITHHAVLQIELHPYLTQTALLNLTKTLGITVTAYSSFGPASFVELNMDRDTPSLLEHNTVAEIAQSKGRSE